MTTCHREIYINRMLRAPNKDHSSLLRPVFPRAIVSEQKANFLGAYHDVRISRGPHRSRLFRHYHS
jgi:hypothetical protein